MSIRLVHSEPAPATLRQLLRLFHDTEALRAKLTGAEVRFAYEVIERSRDNLSRILERADHNVSA